MKSIKVHIILAFATIALAVSCKHLPPIGFIDGLNDPNQFDEIPCDPDSVYFENDILPIISTNCAYSECHDAQSHKEGIILNNYANIMSGGEIRAGRPSNSKLYEVIMETDPKDVMPPPPHSPLSSEQKALIKKWIEQGAKNNGCDDCDTSGVIPTYSDKIANIIYKNCNSCHKASVADGGVVLDSYIGVKTQVDNGKLKGAINHQTGYKVMPPSGIKISSCSIDQIESWISDGAKDN